MPITVAGLPAHPLLVHAVVVLVPLAALGAITISVRPAWNRPYGPLVAAAALAAAGAATLGYFAGQQLRDAIDITPGFVPVIDEHARRGLWAVVGVWPFAVLAVATAVLALRSRRRAGRVTGLLSALAGVAALVTTVLAGHSGSAAVWGAVPG